MHFMCDDQSISLEVPRVVSSNTNWRARMTGLIVGLIVGVTALLSANVPDAAAQGGWKSFRCGNGDTGQIQFPNAGNALVQFRGETVLLRQQGGSARYLRGDWLLEIVGSARNISLEVPDYGQVSCYFLNARQVRPQPTPQPRNEAGLLRRLPARSLGGNIRRGPGLNHRVISNLPPGTPIQLYRRTKKFYAGYPWFEITYADRGAYMLGSLICSQGQRVQ